VPRLASPGRSARIVVAMTRDGDFIVNPRRGPRAPVRCEAHVSLPGGGGWASWTEDIGPRGCQATAPAPIAKGLQVGVLVKNDAAGEPLRVTGHIAWCSPQAPWRVGIAFDDHLAAASSRWFERLLKANPQLGSFGRIPEKIPVDTTLFMAAPPRFLVDFTPDEVAVLRQIASGITVDELRVRLRDRWATALRALFSLLARQHVTLSRGSSVHPDSWKKILADFEAALALEAFGRPTPPPRPAAAPPAPKAAPPPPPAAAPALAPAPVPRSAARRATWSPEEGGGPGGDFEGAGVGWRQARPRSAQAQSAFDRAMAEIDAGRPSAGLSLLRRALSLAPGDPDIAAVIGKLAFLDR